MSKHNPAIRLTTAIRDCATLLTSRLRANGDRRNKRESSLSKNNKNTTTFNIKTQSCNPANKGHMRLCHTVNELFEC